MYEKILITTMGEYMDQIIEHTLDLVHGREIEVIGLYVVDTNVPFLTPANVKKMMVEELKKRGMDILASMKKEFDTPSTCMVNFRPVIAEGDPAGEILKIAEKENVDIIVMGTGKSKIDKHLLGSVSEKVVHSAPCTVLLVRTT